jgi:hypothetical protein
VRWPPVVLALICGAICLALGVAALFARAELLDRDRFAERAVSALDDEAVRTVLTREVTARIVEAGGPPARLARSQIRAAVAGTVRDPAFGPIARTAIADAHDQVLDDNVRRPVLALGPAVPLVGRQLEREHPLLARGLVAVVKRADVRLEDVDRARRVARTADRLGGAGLLLVPLGLMLVAIGVLAAPRRGAALVVAGVTVAVAAAVVALAPEAARGWVVGAVQPESRPAAGPVWDALTDGLATWAILLAIGGLAAAAIGVVMEIAGSARGPATPAFRRL